MSRLPRPHIPISVRLQVAKRQLARFDILGPYCVECEPTDSDGVKLKAALRYMFGDAKPELHHRPALVNRRRYKRHGKIFYDPPANDPDFLFYLLDDDHDIETRVRGVGAQRSDLSQRRYLNKVERNRKKRKPRRKHTTPAGYTPMIKTDVVWSGRKLKRPRRHRWPSRSFPKGRKFNNRRSR